MEDAVNAAIAKLKTQALEKKKISGIVLSVKNKHTGKENAAEDRALKGTLYSALQSIFRDSKIFQAGESLTGISISKTIEIIASYEQKGSTYIVTVEALDKMNGEQLAQADIQYEIEGAETANMVVVMPIESDKLSPGVKKTFTDVFRGELIKNGFQLVSSDEVDKINTKQIMENLGCSAEQCNIIIAGQIGANKLIKTNYSFVDEGVYFLASVLIDVKAKKEERRDSIQHDGKIATLPQALAKMAKKLAGKDIVVQKAAVPQPQVSGQTGMLVVKSSPTEAMIHLDGLQLREKTDTLLHNLPIGKHEITLSKGNLGASQTVIVLPNKTEQLNLQLKPLMADFQIQSTPSSDVYIDGTRRGVTPLVLKLNVGKHEVELSKVNYQPFKKTVDIQPFVLNKIKKRLVSFPEMEITSIPTGAVVHIGGEWRGHTPLKIKSKPGRKELTFNLDGYEEFKKVVTIKNYGTTKVEARLLELVWLYVNYSPPSASVIVDGKKINFPEEIDLGSINEVSETATQVTTGTHRIKVTHPEAEKDEEVEIDIKPREKVPDVKLVLQLKQAYLSERYDDEFYSWMVKFGGSLTVAAILAYLADSENKSALEAKNNQDAAEQSMLAATTYADAKSYSDSAASYNETIKEHNQKSQQLVVGSALFFGATVYYLFFNYPQFPEQNASWQPILKSDGKLQLSYQYKW